jgi:hypothetical protein
MSFAFVFALADARISVELDSDFEDGKENIPLSDREDSFVEVEFFNVPGKFRIPLSYAVEAGDSGVSEGISGFVVIPSSSRIKSLAGIRVQPMGVYLMDGITVHEGRAGNWSLFSRSAGQGKTRLGVYRRSEGVVPALNGQLGPEIAKEVMEESQAKEPENKPVSAPVPGTASVKPVAADCLVAYVRSGDPASDLVVGVCKSLTKQGYWVDIRYEHESTYLPQEIPSYHLFTQGAGFLSSHPLVPGSTQGEIRQWLRIPTKRLEARRACPTNKP